MLYVLNLLYFEGYVTMVHSIPSLEFAWMKPRNQTLHNVLKGFDYVMTYRKK